MPPSLSVFSKQAQHRFGGLALQAEGWKKTSRHYLFPVRALSKMFGGKFRAGLQRLHAQGQLEFAGPIQTLSQPATFAQLLDQLKTQQPVVYAERRSSCAGSLCICCPSVL